MIPTRAERDLILFARASAVLEGAGCMFTSNLTMRPASGAEVLAWRTHEWTACTTVAELSSAAGGPRMPCAGRQPRLLLAWWALRRRPGAGAAGRPMSLGRCSEYRRRSLTHHVRRDRPLTRPQAQSVVGLDPALTSAAPCGSD